MRAISFFVIPFALFSAIAAPALAGWVPAGGPETLFVDLELDPVHPEVLYGRVIFSQAPEEAYLWRSGDGGRTWSSLQPGLLRPSSALAVDPARSEVLWAWTTESAGWYAGELWRSGDAGATWERRFATPQRELLPSVLALLADPGDPDTVYRVDEDYSAGRRVAVSRDGGATFALGPPVRARLIVPEPASRQLLAFGVGGLLASGDGGRSWRRRGGYRELDFLGGALAPGLPQRLYALPAPGPQGQAPCLVASDDAGATWRRLPSLHLPGTGRCETVAVDPASADHVWLTVGVARRDDVFYSIFESTNGGRSWSPPRPLPDSYLRVKPAAGGVLYAQTDEGVSAPGLYRSDDGGRTWQRRDSGLASDDLRYGLAAVRRADGSSRLVAIGGPGSWNTLIASVDGGAAWKTLPPFAPVALAAVGGRALLMVDERPGASPLQRSPNAGAAWSAVAGGPPSPLGTLETDATHPAGVAMANLDGDFGYGTVVPWLSDDGGATWRSAAAGLPIDCEHVASIDYCPALFAYAADPFGSPRRWLSFGGYLPQLFVSDDGGASWRAPAEPPPAPHAFLSDPAVRGRLLAGTVHGLAESRDGGEHWHPLGVGLPADAVVHQLLRDTASGVLYAATVGRGIFHSADEGATWTELAGEPDLEPPLLALDGSTLLAAFREQGLWRWVP